jgi:SAM-dependent methyltransferase
VSERNWSEEIADAWRESAPYWEKHGETIRRMFAPITDVLLEGARVEPGHRVLDVAGGPGEPALTIARATGASGLVVHTDLAPGMAAGARRAAARERLENLRFALASGIALPFADRAFDRVVCRLGVMFFPAPEAGVAEMLRVARDGGRVALAVWGDKEKNPFFRIPSECVARYLETEPEPPDAPGAWRFAEPGLLAGMLEAAGGAEVAERRFDFEIAAPLDFDAFWTMRVELSDTLRDKTERLGPELAARVKEDAREATREVFAGGAMRFPAEALVVSAVRPGL